MLKYLVWLNLLFTMLLILIGSIVDGGSLGLTCTQWPICYEAGSLETSPLMAMLHRAFAGFVVLIHVYLLLKRESFSKSKNLLLQGSFVILIVQSILGAFSVYYKFPTIMGVVHLVLSIVYLILLLLINDDQPREFPKLSKESYSTVLKDILRIMVSIIFLQFLIGGIVNHGGARLACTFSGMIGLGCYENSNIMTFFPVLTSSKILQLHKYLGVLLALLFISYVFFLKKQREIRQRDFLIFTVVVGFIFMSQYFLGSLLLLSETPFSAGTVHLLLAITLIIYLLKKLNYLNAYEINSFGTRQRSMLEDMFEMMKLRLGALVMATVVCGVLLTGQFIDFFYILFALLLTTMVVASATTLNCYIEKDVDAKMERTRDRALPSGRLSPKVALIQGMVLIILSMVLMVIYVNWQTALLGFVAFALYLFVYTPMKLKSPFALYVGAIPGAIPPVMGRTIVVGEIDAMAWTLFAILFIWQIPHFMAISIYNKDDYQAGGIKVYSHSMSPKLLKVLIFLLTVLLVGISLIPFYIDFSNSLYFWSAVVIGLIFVVVSALGAFTGTGQKYIDWSRQYFRMSIIYLPILLLAMIFFS